VNRNIAASGRQIRKGISMKSTWYSALFKAGVLALALTSPVALVTAQTPDDLTQKSLEDLMNIEVDSVYSASKYSQKVTEAPSSVSIVTAEQIQRHGYRTLAEILGSVRGFYVSNDRNYTSVGVRGFAPAGDYNTRILLLIDGHRINDNIYEQGLLGRELPIEVDLIERVEIVRGPSSSLYGTSAFFAVVNVITKRGRHVNGFEASTEVASFGTYKARLTYGRKLSESSEVLLSGSYYDSAGRRRLYVKEFDTPVTNNGIAENADDEKSASLFANVTFKEVTLHAIYGSREKGIPTASYGTVYNDRRTRTTDRRGYLDLQYDHTFSNQVELMARASYDSYTYDGTYIFDYSDNSTPQIAFNKDALDGRWWSGELQLTRTVRKHRMTFGTEYRDNLRQNQFNFDLGTEPAYLDDRRKSKNFAFFAQDEFRIRENLTLSAGVRYDHHSVFGGTAKPRVALIYHPGAKTTVKLLYGEAFRAPTNFEIYYGAGEFFKPSPNLRPETIKTTEVVFEKYLGDHLRLSASGYVYHIKGLITQALDPADGLLSFRNDDEIASKGLEFEIAGKLPHGFEGNGSYALQQTRDRETGLEVTNSARHLGKLNLMAPLFKRSVIAAFQLQYSSQRLTLNGTNLPALYLANFTLFSKKLAKGLDTSFGVYNLFNQKYADPGSEAHRQNSIEQDGRNLRLKFTFHF
jgi:outer membrane receptor for ferrienterochelin and colicins